MHNFESVFFLTCLYYFVTVTTNDPTTQKSQSFTMAIITITWWTPLPCCHVCKILYEAVGRRRFWKVEGSCEMKDYTNFSQVFFSPLFLEALMFPTWFVVEETYPWLQSSFTQRVSNNCVCLAFIIFYHMFSKCHVKTEKKKKKKLEHTLNNLCIFKDCV